MRTARLICIVSQLCLVVDSQRTELDSPLNVRLLRAFREWSLELFGRTGTEARLLRSARYLDKIQPQIPENVPFPCDVTLGRSAEVPSSVHKLRPGDIDVIGALGDSLSAGAGVFASSVLHVVIENRGVAAASGGQGTWREYLTIPNILKEFNKKLVGYALGDSFTFQKESQLNVAETGAMSRDVPFMAKQLIKRIRNDPRINVEKDWKLISLMIGPNDFCTDMCWIESPWSILEDHKRNLLTVLRTLRDNLPRTFVNVIPAPNVNSLVEAQEGRYSIKCDLTLTTECSCLFGLQFAPYRQEYTKIIKKWQALEEEIAGYPEFETNEFAVVVQPITTNLTLPTAPDGYSDFSYLSEDCFHISQKGNGRFANALWNSMLEPVGHKTRNWDKIYKRFLCPTPERPYLFTNHNSKKINSISSN